jgi:site-specific DNA-adenine methylase
MTLKNLQKAPFPWFGGKSKAAPLVWELLGDVEHYVEPFAGSLAVLLNRPHVPNRSYHSETVNDMDGLLVNAWRAIQWHPEETAAHASWPVSENDKHARQIALVRWREAGLVDKLAGSPKWCDTEMAGWWLWGVCVQIGAFAAGGPWTADDNGMIVKIDRKAESRGEPGVKRDLPHLADDGKGVNRPAVREPGVTRIIPRTADDGAGINTAAVREPGVKRDFPHLGSNGQGINRPAAREPGVLSDQPDNEFHPNTMPELIRWFQWLSARLRHVRILNGDWARLVTNGATKTLNVRMGDGHAGIFLDPPYADTANRSKGLYGVDDLDVAHLVKTWCAKNGNDPDRRIVLAGYDGEHDDQLADLSWTAHEWYTAGFLQGGYSNGTEAGTQQGRERLWASPHCLNPDDQPAHTQGDLFA